MPSYCRALWKLLVLHISVQSYNFNTKKAGLVLALPLPN